MSHTRKAAASIIVALVLALAAPTAAAPFADVPPNHWAFDALSELAAKGLIEGYPDGFFRGDYPLTRFEMAIVIARVVARIEAIPLPPAPAQVPPALLALPARVAAGEARIAAMERVIALLKRLTGEFRVELIALGVQVAAIEERLAAIDARLDRTRITGEFTYEYWGRTIPAGAPALSLGRITLAYAGDIAPGIVATLRVRYLTFPGEIVVDRAFLDWNGVFGIEDLGMRVGRQTVELGPIGLLLGARDDHREGLQVAWTADPVATFGFIQWAGVDQTPPQAFIAGGRVSFAPIQGWTMGLSIRSDGNPWVPAYGGSGFGADISGAALPGVRLTAEYASYTPVGLAARTYLYAEAALDLGTVVGIRALAPTLTFWYRDMDPLAPGGFLPNAVGAPRPNPIAPDFRGEFGGGDLRTFGARLGLTLSPAVTAWGLIDTGTVKSTGAVFTTWEAGARWALAPNASLSVFYADNTRAVVRTTYWGTFLSANW